MNGIRIRFETKPGKSFASAGTLPNSSASSTIERGGLVGRVAPADDLDELQHRHRVEEVHADHPVGALRARRERRDRDRGRVRREDGVRRKRRVGAPEHVLLHVGVLDDRFDHQVGRDELVDRLTRASTSSGCGSALLLELREALAHRLERALGRAGLRVVERDAASRARDDLCDATAHLPGTDDENVLEAHSARLADACRVGGEDDRFTWDERPAIRVSVSNWQTSEADMERLVGAFRAAVVETASV